MTKAKTNRLYNIWSDKRYFQLYQMAEIMQDFRKRCQEVLNTKGIDEQGKMVFRNVLEGVSAGESNLFSMARKEYEINPPGSLERRKHYVMGKGRSDRPLLDPTYTGRFFTIKDLTELLGITRQAIYDRIKAKRLPKPYRLIHRSVWREDDLNSHGITIPKRFKPF